METYLEDLGHLALLRERAVVLDGQDDRHVRIDERSPVDGFHHILEEHGREFSLETLIKQTKLKQAPVQLSSEFNYSYAFSDLEGYFSGECVSVVNNRHAVISIPAVQLNAPAALQQHLRDKHTHTRLEINT